MGEPLKTIGIKMPPDLHDRFTRARTAFGPFAPTVSRFGAGLLDAALRAIEAGIIQRPCSTLQGLFPSESVTTITQVNRVNPVNPYPWKGISRSEQEAKDFVAMVLERIAETERVAAGRTEKKRRTS